MSPDGRSPSGRNWLLFAGSLVVALALAEAACRFLLPRPGFVPLIGNWMPGAIRPHPTRTYALAPGFSARIAADAGTMDVTISADGLRDAPLEERNKADLRILAVGDSFTFGYGLDQALAWPGQLERVLARALAPATVAVINAGVPGYNLQQMDATARELLPKANPSVLVAAVYADGFDRLDDPLTALADIVIRSSDTRVVRRVDGGLIRSPMYQPALVNADLWLKQHWYFGALLFEGAYRLGDGLRELLRDPGPGVVATGRGGVPPTRFAAGMKHLASLQAQARAASIPLVVLMVTRFDPATHRVNTDDDRVAGQIGRFCAQAGIPFVYPRGPLEAAPAVLQAKRGDYHWSAAANAIAAEQLGTFLLESRVLPPANATGD